MKTENKPIPSLRSDAEAEEFLETANLAEYDLSDFKPMRFESKTKATAPAKTVPPVPKTRTEVRRGANLTQGHPWTTLGSGVRENLNPGPRFPKLKWVS